MAHSQPEGSKAGMGLLLILAEHCPGLCLAQASKVASKRPKASLQGGSLSNPNSQERS